MSEDYDGDDSRYSALSKKSIPYLSNIHRQADRQKFSTYLLQAHEVRGYTVFSYATNTGDKLVGITVL